MATQPPSPPPEPLTLDEVRLNLRVETAANDNLITALISTAREYVESYTGLVLTPRTITETVASLGRWIELASWPVTSVTQIRCEYGGLMVALSGAAWRVSYVRRPVRIVPSSFAWGVPASCMQRPILPVEIDVQAGFATPQDVPLRARHAMQMLIAHWYANRVGVETGLRAAAIEVPMGVTLLLDSLRLQQV